MGLRFWANPHKKIGVIKITGNEVLCAFCFTYAGTGIIVGCSKKVAFIIYG